MALSGFLSFFVRGNPVIAMAMAWISNPYTAVPIYWFNYVLGCWVVGGEAHGWAWFADFINPTHISGFAEHMRYAYGKIYEIFFPLFLGSVVAGIPLAFVAYVWVYRYVKRREDQAMTRSS